MQVKKNYNQLYYTQNLNRAFFNFFYGTLANINKKNHLN